MAERLNASVARTDALFLIFIFNFRYYLYVRNFLALLLLIPSFSFANAEYSKFIEVKKSINEIMQDGYIAKEIFSFDINSGGTRTVIHFFKGKKYIICYIAQGSLCQKPLK